MKQTLLNFLHIMAVLYGVAFAVSCNTNEPDNPSPGTISVISVSLSSNALSLEEGQTETLTATVKPDNATNKKIVWASGDPKVATVVDGVVTAINAGTTDVTAISQDGEKKAICTVTVLAKATPSVTMGAEQISAVSAVLFGKANIGSVVASDIEMGILYSTSSGVIASNSTKIKATNMDGNYNYSVNATVLEPETTYYYRSYVSQNGQDTYGETKHFTTKELSSMLETLDATNVEASCANLNAKLDLTDVKYTNLEYGFVWGTSENSLGKYSEGGAIANHAFASSLTDLKHITQYWYQSCVKINDRTYNGEIRSFTTDAIHVESVSIDKTELTLDWIGAAWPLYATVLPNNATNKTVSWSSSDEGVVTVDDRGYVTAIGNGIATITVTTMDQEKTATCLVTVAQMVTDLKVTGTNVLIEGESTTLTTSVEPDNAYDKTLIWTSSDESVAKVDANGTVTAISLGHATISAIPARDIYSISCSHEIYVVGTGAVDLGLSVKWASCNIGALRPEESGGFYAWGETETKNDYSWQTYKWVEEMYDDEWPKSFSKYNPSTGGKRVLELCDDVANVKLGGRWRIPTNMEIYELQRSCSCSFVNMYGVEGFILSSNVNGYIGISLFLPATGYMDGTEVSFITYGQVTAPCSYIWSNTIYSDYDPMAITLFAFWEEGFLPQISYDLYFPRYRGTTVRPVFE